jgi:hypothetical protein
MAPASSIPKSCLPETRDLYGPKDLCILLAGVQGAGKMQSPPLGSADNEAGLSSILYYLCSKSTGVVTSCTRKYFARAGYFPATA